MATSFRLQLQRPFINNLTSPQRASVRLSPPGRTSAGRAYLWITDDDKGQGRGVDIDRWEAARIAAAIQRYADTGEVEPA